MIKEQTRNTCQEMIGLMLKRPTEANEHEHWLLLLLIDSTGPGLRNTYTMDVDTALGWRCHLAHAPVYQFQTRPRQAEVGSRPSSPV